MVAQANSRTKTGGKIQLSETEVIAANISTMFDVHKTTVSLAMTVLDFPKPSRVWRRIRVYEKDAINNWIVQQGGFNDAKVAIRTCKRKYREEQRLRDLRERELKKQNTSSFSLINNIFTKETNE